MNNLELYGVVGVDFTVATVSRQLEGLDGDVTVTISSPGGDAFDGIAIANVLKAHDGVVNAQIIGLAASAASVIAFGGCDRVEISTMAEVMIHNAQIGTYGDCDDLEHAAGRLRTMNNTIAQVYASRAGGSVEFWLERMKAETWYSADEAVAAGLADAVFDFADDEVEQLVNKAGVITASNDKAKYKGRSEAPDPVLCEVEHMDFKDEIRRLIGVDNSTEDSEIIAALVEVLNEQADSVEESAKVNDENVAESDSEASEDSEGVNTPKETENASEETTGANSGDSEEDSEEETEENTTEDTTENTEEENTEETEENTEDPEATGTGSSELEDVVAVDRGVFEDLKRRAALGDEAAENMKREKAQDLVSAAIHDGKVLAVKREALVDAAIDDFEGVKAHLDSLEAGIIPVVEKGRGKVTKKDKETTGAGLANLFAPSKV